MRYLQWCVLYHSDLSREGAQKEKEAVVSSLWGDGAHIGSIYHPIYGHMMDMSIYAVYCLSAGTYQDMEVCRKMSNWLRSLHTFVSLSQESILCPDGKDTKEYFNRDLLWAGVQGWCPGVLLVGTK